MWRGLGPDNRSEASANSWRPRGRTEIEDKVVTTLLTVAASLIGLYFGNLLGARTTRRDRLRSLFVEVMQAALRLTPKALHMKLSDDNDIPLPAEIDGFVARLMVEAEGDDDAVRTAFIDVFNRSAAYRVDRSNINTPNSEIRRDEADVRSSVAALQKAIRQRLGQ